jgi:glycolate oxidase FAD binding subunit
MGADLSNALAERVRQAAAEQTPMRIVGGGSKHFYGRDAAAGPGGPANTAVLEVAAHSGIVNYEPTELVVTARAGTPLVELEQALTAQGQMLPFEPPHFGVNATLGGTLACGFSGPRRPYAGAARDFVLGMQVINGKGEILRFGGEVMKNVAGYDVSRLLVGSLGTLGVILESSLKVLPKPTAEVTQRQTLNLSSAITRMNELARQPLPLSGACFIDDTLYLRLSGTAAGVASARVKIGGDEVEPEEGEAFWAALRDHQLPFFSPARDQRPLWRLSLPPTTPPLNLPGRELLDWGGALRWLWSDATPERVRETATKAGGQATLFRRGNSSAEVFQALPLALARLHKNLKQAFDPNGVLNPYRMYPDW